VGLLERLDPAQCRIDDLVERIERNIIENNPRVFLDDGADVPVRQVLEGSVGLSIIRYDSRGGNPPTFMVPSSVSPQDIEWLKECVEWLYSMAGMDQASAAGTQSVKESSGRAILFQHEMQTQRYVDWSKRLSDHVRDVMSRLLDACRRLSADEPNWTVRYAKGSIVKKIDWADVRMDRDQYVIELEEVSPVPDSFSGRLEQLEEDATAGRVPPEYLAQLRQDPDLWRGRFQAARAEADYVDSVIDRLLEPDGPMPTPIDEAPLDSLMQAVRTELLEAIASKDDPRVVKRLRQYLAELAESAPPPTAGTDPAADQPTGGGGGGQPPPSSQPPPQQ
jgi:hypothetical protein